MTHPVKSKCKRYYEYATKLRAQRVANKKRIELKSAELGGNF